ncbi:DUF3309 family protein [Caenispirillum salinarum]|uniref:DUF3309 family protein n=1 Tax=Caenispirillum salinarum TaxID=859058 RepID=UPI00384FC194
MAGFWILVLLLLLWIVALPWWPYSRDWTYWPGGVVFAVVLTWLFLIWLGFVGFYWPWYGPAV